MNTHTQKSITTRTALGIVMLLLFVVSFPAYAATVSNDVSVTANGGDSSASVRVRTEINGEVVLDYSETTSSGTASYSSTMLPDENKGEGAASEATIATYKKLVALLALLERILGLGNEYD